MTLVQVKQSELLKSVVKFGKDIPYNPTQYNCDYWWHVINNVVFDNRLTVPHKFVIKKLGCDYGYCQPYISNGDIRLVEICMNSEIDNLYKFICIMIHESVHQWEWEILNEWRDDGVQHTKQFYSWRELILERTGAPLTSTY